MRYVGRHRNVPCHSDAISLTKPFARLSPVLVEVAEAAPQVLGTLHAPPEKRLKASDRLIKHLRLFAERAPGTVRRGIRGIVECRDRNRRYPRSFRDVAAKRHIFPVEPDLGDRLSETGRDGMDVRTAS